MKKLISLLIFCLSVSTFTFAQNNSSNSNSNLWQNFKSNLDSAKDWLASLFYSKEDSSKDKFQCPKAASFNINKTNNINNKNNN